MSKRRFNVQMEDPDGNLHSWGGEAEDSGHAVDLAREDLDPNDTLVVVDVEEESN